MGSTVPAPQKWGAFAVPAPLFDDPATKTDHTRSYWELVRWYSELPVQRLTSSLCVKSRLIHAVRYNKIDRSIYNH